MDIGMAAQNKRNVGAFGIGLQDIERFDAGSGIETGQVHVFDPQPVRFVFILATIAGENDAHDRVGAQLRDLLGGPVTDSV